ncbi:MAG: hypothetical protein ACOY0T_22935 [Myxococcota bacterium]
MIGVRWAILPVALSVAACGGDNSAPRPEPNYCRPINPVSDSPDPGSPPVDCNALDGYEIYPLDYFESGGTVEPSTSWYTNSDRTALQDPVPDQTVPFTPIPNGRCIGAARSANAATVCTSPTAARGSCTEPALIESRRAVHVRSGLLTLNGGQLGRDLPKTPATGACEFTPGPPEIGPCSAGMGPSAPQKGSRAINDFSDWDGLVLWLRVAPGSAAYLRVRVADGTVDDKGCVCNPYTSQNDSSSGCDKWGRYISIDTTFRAYFIAFDEMQQGGWGLKSNFLDTSNLFSLGVEWGRGAWDLWIDDVAFYRRRK